METPKAYILRQSKKYYAVRCPFCKSQHYHRIYGTKTNVLKGCAEERWMSPRERYNTRVSNTIYNHVKTYDLEWPDNKYKDSLYTNTYTNPSYP